MKYLGFLLVVIIGLFFSGCASNTKVSPKKYSKIEPHWIKDQNGCKRWNPEPTQNETITWTGKCVNGYVDGYGTLQWYEDGVAGTKDIGTFRKGKAEGRVKRISANQVYTGKFKNDLHNGKGTVIYRNGNKYVGEWKDAKKDGQGTFSFNNGDKFNGIWKNNRMYSGKGIFYSHGKKSSGTFRNGRIYTGKGEYYDPFIRYIGEFKNGKPHGQGEFVYTDGTRDIGGFKNGKRHGKIIKTFSDGEINIFNCINGNCAKIKTRTVSNIDMILAAALVWVGYGISEGMENARNAKYVPQTALSITIKDGTWLSSTVEKFTIKVKNLYKYRGSYEEEDSGGNDFWSSSKAKFYVEAGQKYQITAHGFNKSENEIFSFTHALYVDKDMQDCEVDLFRKRIECRSHNY